MLEHTTLTARVNDRSAWELTESKRRLLRALLQAWQCCSMKTCFVIKSTFGDQVFLPLFLEIKAQIDYMTFARLCEPKVLWEEKGENEYLDLPLVRSGLWLWLVLPTGPVSSFRFFPTLFWPQPKSIESAGQNQKYFHAIFLPIEEVEKGNSPYSSELRSNWKASRGREKDVENIAKGVYGWLM